MSERAATTQDRALGAFVASAVGDAMGWPFEDRSRRVDSSREQAPSKTGFMGWTRRTGTRFWAHLEPIEPGEYSDDTQLTLSVARSFLRAGAGWWDFLCRVELPAWTVYERGGGRATKAAASLWAKGNAPWQSNGRKAYWGAGGNGVAMRILPHVLLRVRDDEFRGLAESVLVDGIATHGHPRALVGAIAQAYACWTTIRRGSSLDYGELLERLTSDFQKWGQLPDTAEEVSAYSDWREEADRLGGGGYRDLWDQSVTEMRNLFSRASEMMEQGALSVDREALEALGAVGSTTKGAGTISTAAAVFLASRYAADPVGGLDTASRLRAADTDTLAAMTGAILGGIAGRDWLGRVGADLQDAPYVIRLGAALLELEELSQANRCDVAFPPQASVQGFSSEVRETEKGAVLTMPDGRRGRVMEKRILEPVTQSAHVTRVKLELEDGQTIYAKGFTRRKEDSSDRDEPARDASRRRPDESPRARRLGFQFSVRNLEHSRQFYEQALGLAVTKEGKGTVTFEGILILREASEQDGQLNLGIGSESPAPSPFVLFVETESVEVLAHRIVDGGWTLVREGWLRRGRMSVRCADPDGNLVDLIEGPAPGGD